MGQKLLGSAKLIAHRGNFNGANKDLENSIPYLQEALRNGYDIEVDLWFINNNFYFGHDDPRYKASSSFIENIVDHAWFHCKNLEAIEKVSSLSNARYFWHQEDDFALTSNGLIWTYPGKEFGSKSIVVDLTDSEKEQYSSCYGICGDYLE